MTTENFLVELGTEELPPKSLLSLASSFTENITSNLNAAGISFDDSKVKTYATPRRLAVYVGDLATQQADKHIEKLGPNVAAAFDKDGNPSKAALGFAKSNGTSVDALSRVQTDKGERLCFKISEPGKATTALLDAIVSDALAKLPIAKRMRWGASREEFVRPVHWLVMMMGEAAVPAKVLGLTSTNQTRGHRFHCNRSLTLASADSYSDLLANEGHVVADFALRREQIVEQVNRAATELGGIAVIDDALLDEVTALVEKPVALAGRFDETYLNVPAEALISSMSEHQKYFHVVDTKQNLLPHFITVANINSSDPAQIIDGNERVIRPRLADAAFFFETDKKTTLACKRDKLKTVVFQQRLGTVFEKTERISKLAVFIAEQLQQDVAAAQTAGELCKADLVSDMVLEFDKMQGIAGAYYARHDGESDAVADAIREHYLPKHAGDDLPASLLSCCVALADRIDTLIGIFGIGQSPTGSKDPFALRRASISVLQIIVQKKLSLDLKALLNFAYSNYNGVDAAEDVIPKTLNYMIERFRAWYQDEGIATEVFVAVSAKQLSNPLDIHKRVQAVNAFSQLEEAQALAAANKRVSNILDKQSLSAEQLTIKPELLSEAAEQKLADALQEKQQQVSPLLAEQDYESALLSLASLREPIDAFFDNVMVMAEDDALRMNRVALLHSLRELFLEVADISLLATTK